MNQEYDNGLLETRLYNLLGWEDTYALSGVEQRVYAHDLKSNLKSVISANFAGSFTYSNLDQSRRRPTLALQKIRTDFRHLHVQLARPADHQSPAQRRFDELSLLFTQSVLHIFPSRSERSKRRARITRQTNRIPVSLSLPHISTSKSDDSESDVEFGAWCAQHI